MSKSVKFADVTFIDNARAEAETQSRSLADQIIHWARIGRAVERSQSYDHAKISRVLMGEVETTILTGEEKAVWSDQFMERMSEPGLAEEAFFKKLRESGKAVDVKTSGETIWAKRKSDQGK